MFLIFFSWLEGTITKARRMPEIRPFQFFNIQRCCHIYYVVHKSDKIICYIFHILRDVLVSASVLKSKKLFSFLLYRVSEASSRPRSERQRPSSNFHDADNDSIDSSKGSYSFGSSPTPSAPPPAAAPPSTGGELYKAMYDFEPGKFTWPLTIQLQSVAKRYSYM